MAVPSTMIALSLVLPPRINRWVNIILGAVYTLIMMAAIQNSWNFYVFFGFVEIALTISIVWCAWTWPREPAH
jgi:uncharacterized BrkB/YihY/UPF0761 family membrane protein